MKFFASFYCYAESFKVCRCTHSYVASISFICLPMDQLLIKPIESLEGQSKEDSDFQLARLSAYGLRSASDFDKYTALSMAESVARETHRLSHEKVSFLDVGVQGLCPRLQAYFLALSRIQITRRCWTACLRSTKAIRRRPLHPPKPPPSLRASLLALTD